MIKALVASAVILGILLVGLYVDALYHRFERRHPALGPFRAEGGGCGRCACGGGSCSTRE